MQLANPTVTIEREGNRDREKEGGGVEMNCLVFMLLVALLAHSRSGVYLPEKARYWIPQKCHIP